VDGHGELDRAALGRLVFDDSIARKDLEGIVHPAIGAEFRARVAEILSVDPDAIVVYDIPLLVETNRVSEFDSVIVVACEPSVRHDRLVSLRGFTSEDAWARINAQSTEQERRDVADWIIESGTSVEATLAQTDTLWSTITDRYRA
jgi:dephospho-CoA kinase